MFLPVKADIAPRAISVALPMWGRITQFLRVNKGLSVGSGSGDVTSKPAAAIWWLTNACGTDLSDLRVHLD